MFELTGRRRGVQLHVHRDTGAADDGLRRQFGAGEGDDRAAAAAGALVDGQCGRWGQPQRAELELDRLPRRRPEGGGRRDRWVW